MKGGGGRNVHWAETCKAALPAPPLRNPQGQPIWCGLVLIERGRGLKQAKGVEKEEGERIDGILPTLTKDLPKENKKKLFCNTLKDATMGSSEKRLPNLVLIRELLLRMRRSSLSRL